MMTHRIIEKLVVLAALALSATSAQAMVVDVPEPSSLTLIGLGVIGLIITRRRSKQ